MFILLHVIIALGSIGLTALTFFAPSVAKLRIASFTTALTVITGTYLVITTHSSMLSVCMMGLFYIGGMISALITSQRKLARQNESSNSN